MAESLEPIGGESGEELDRIIRALADKRRRYVLYDLSIHGGFVALTDLARRLAEWLGVGDQNKVQVGLLHTHLPTLEVPNLIEFDSVAHSVSITTKGEIANDSRAAYVEQFMAKCC